MTPGNDDLNEMVEDTSPESRRATRGPVSGSDPALAALHAALTDLASDPAPTPTGELAPCSTARSGRCAEADAAGTWAPSGSPSPPS